MNGETVMDRCTICGEREPIYTRAYSGESLCRRCFVRSIMRKVRATISKYGMFKHDDRIAVAVSGGKDSTALLHVMAEIERRFPKSTLVAVTVDEGIKGYRDEALSIALENSKLLGVEHITVSFKELYGYTLDEIVEMSSGTQLTPCAICGVLRRRALNVAARIAKAEKIATAHNLDDEVQTVILNIMHGDPFRIARVKPVLEPATAGFVRRVKPFCEVPEREVALYAYIKGIKFQDLPCPYAETALRNEIRNMLNRLEERHPGIKYAIFRSAERMRPYLEKALSELKMRRCVICGEPSVGEICQPCQILRDLKILE
ncbi:MAG: ATP pyrophosphatase [Candidatus Bathyarchaeota archaeon B26-1]|nr:MAG: ATP pyrophosphatase [Candidatus Bathyarchaeota archaeon B26-1]